MKVVLKLLFVILFVPCCLFSQSPEKPPAAPVKEFHETLFGMEISDPYRWMEESNNQEFLDWLKGQNAYTRQVIDQIPGRANLLKRIQELDDAGTLVYTVQRVGDQYFYYKQAPGYNNPRLFVRRGYTGPETLLLNPDAFEQGNTHYSVDYYFPSLDGSLVAVGVSSGGSEESVLYLVDTKTGKRLSDQIDRARFASVAWLPDSKSFFYTRLQKLPENAAVTDKFLKTRVYLHKIGADPDKDMQVFGYDLLPELQPAEGSFVFYSPASPKYLFGYVTQFVRNEAQLYFASLDEVQKGKAKWQKIVSYEDNVTQADVKGDDVFLLSHQNASHYQVLRTSLLKPDVAHAEMVYPEQKAIARSISVAEDALYIQLLDGGLSRLVKVPFGKKPVEVPLPFKGSINEWAVNPRHPGVLMKLTSWTKPQLWFVYDPAKETVTNTELRPLSPVDYSAITSEEVLVKSYDGTMVPLSIIYRKDIKKDGSNPTLLSGYGAYGISQDPGFNPVLLAWLERGGVYAQSHIRGGGEYGEEWHLAGKQDTKKNTWLDFIACGEYLIAQGYTSSAHLAGEGTSAGGITIGRAITTRPDLFRAAVSNVGVSDAIRFEFGQNGPPNIPEFGSTKTEAGFKALYEMDAYVHVKDGTAYPAVLLTTGMNDPRVDPWEAGKMTARLQSASSSGNPVLLRVDFDAGHGIGSTKDQFDREYADQLSFLFWQLGAPEFARK